MHITRITIATLLCLGGAFAQSPDPGRGEVREPFVPQALQSALSLVGSQVEFLRENNRMLRDELRPLARNMADKQRELRRELRNDPPNEAIVGAITMELEQINGQMEEVRDQYHEMALTILGTAQVDALAPLQEAAEHWHVIREAAAFNLITLPEADRDEQRSRSQQRGPRRR